jgi:hypothetical protein
MFNRKKTEFIKVKTDRRQKHYEIYEGDEVAMTIYGRYEGGTLKTMSGSYFLLPAGKHIIDPDIVIERLQPRKGKHA